MNKMNRFLLVGLACLVIAGLAAPGVLALPLGQASWLKALQPAGQPAAAEALFSPDYHVHGQIKLDYAVPGQHSDALQAPEPGTLPELGTIDLGLALERQGGSLSGYVDLDYTMVFTGEHKLDGTALGPALSGSMEGVNISLVSERVSLVSGGVPLQRQFSLQGELINQNTQFRGEYRETIWGYGSQPLTMVGSFVLEWQGQPGSGVIYLPLISR